MFPEATWTSACYGIPCINEDHATQKLFDFEMHEVNGCRLVNPLISDRELPLFADLLGAKRFTIVFFYGA